MINLADSQKSPFFLLLTAFIFTVFITGGLLVQADTTSAEFQMQEITVFDEPEIPGDFLVGVRAETDFESISEVMSYPVFKSEKVLYGSVQLGRDLFRLESGKLYYFAIDESAGTDTGYDRFYFDINGDNDLTNDKILSAQTAPPEGALWRITSAERHICYEHFALSLDTSYTDSIPVEIMPRLTLTKGGGRLMRFIAVKAHKGPVEIAGYKYNAYLGYPFMIHRSYDQVGTSLYLVAEQESRHSNYFMNYLISMHQVDGKLYRFSAAPDGSKLTVKPYDGKFGTFKIHSKQLLGRNKNIYGGLASRDAIVQIGSPDNLRDGKKLSSAKVPVGDYQPMLMDVHLDSMHISISDNPHSNGKARDNSKEKTFSIKIREDKPFDLGFSNEPEVIIVSPA